MRRARDLPIRVPSHPLMEGSPMTAQRKAPAITSRRVAAEVRAVRERSLQNDQLARPTITCSDETPPLVTAPAIPDFVQ